MRDWRRQYLFSWQRRCAAGAAEEARRIIRRALTIDTPGEPYISSSWGKDSAVLTHLVHSVDPSVRVVTMMSFTTFAPGDVEEIQRYIDEVGCEWVKLHWEKAPRLRAAVEGYKQGAGHQAHKGQMEVLVDWIDQHPVSSFFLGLRAEEAKGRRLSGLNHGKLYRMKHGPNAGSYRCTPMMWWDEQDVWSYHLMHELPMLDIYRRQGPHVRSGMFGRTGLEEGRLTELYRSHPDLANRLMADFQEFTHWR